MMITNNTGANCDLGNILAKLLEILCLSPKAFGIASTNNAQWLQEDWDNILAMARMNGVMGHIHPGLMRLSLEGTCPVGLASGLSARARDVSFRSMALRAELIRLLGIFQKGGVEVMALKGPMLADQYHDFPNRRESGDLDLFVKEECRDRAWQLLEEHGYTSPYENHSLDQRYHVVFHNKQTREVVELHWRVAGPQYGKYYRGEFLWKDIRTISYHGSIALQPSAEATLAYLAIHAYKHGWERLQWLMDIPQVAGSSGFDWDRLYHLVRAIGATRLLIATIQLSGEILPSGPQPPPMHPLRRGILSADQIKRIRRRITRPTLDWEEFGDFFKLRVAMAETASDRLRLIADAIRPADPDFAAINAPRWLRPAGMLMRPFRLLSRAFRQQSRLRERLDDDSR